VASHLAVQQPGLLQTGTEDGGNGITENHGGLEGGDDLASDNEAMDWDTEGAKDPHLCREWNVATFQHVPQPLPHSSCDRVSRLMGCGANGDTCSVLAASLQRLECTDNTKQRCTGSTPPLQGAKRQHDDIAWLHNATSSAAREVGSQNQLQYIMKVLDNVHLSRHSRLGVAGILHASSTCFVPAIKSGDFLRSYWINSWEQE
jgi:hypothetical protein